MSYILLETGDHLLTESGDNIPIESEYAQMILTDGAVGYWRLGESSLSTAYDSAGDANGTYQASPTVAVTGIPGVSENTAVTFAQASSQYVSVPDRSAFSIPTTNKLSVEFWFKLAAGAAPYGMIGKADPTLADGSTEWSVTIRSGPVIRFNPDQFSPNVDTGTLTLGTSWHHVVVTADDTIDTTIIYVDTIVRKNATAAWTGTRANTTLSVFIAHDWVTSGSYFDGTMDEVAIYGGILTPDQVSAHYALGFGLFPPRYLITRQAPTRAASW